MASVHNNAEELKSEILQLRRKNLDLQKQLTIYKGIIQELRMALYVVNQSKEDSDPRCQLTNGSLSAKNLNIAGKYERLTRREKQVLKFISKGYTSRQIADQLGISKLTVDTHRKNIQRKLEVSNTVELLKIAMTFS